MGKIFFRILLCGGKNASKSKHMFYLPVQLVFRVAFYNKRV